MVDPQSETGEIMPKDKVICLYKAPQGQTLNQAASDILIRKRRTGDEFMCKFNGIFLSTKNGDTEQELVAAYNFSL